MRYDDLLCAACSGRVVEGRCATCRATRRELPSPALLPAGPLLALALFLVVLLLMLAHATG